PLTYRSSSRCEGRSHFDPLTLLQPRSAIADEPVWKASRHAISRLRFAQLVEGQVRHDPLIAVAVEDDLVGAAQHPLHGLQIHTSAGYLRRLFVLLVDFEEPSGLACRLGHGLLLVGPRGLHDTLGFAARLRNNPAGVRTGFVLQTL